MKKLLVVLVVLLMFVSVLTSCGTPKNVEDLLDKIDKKMESMKSYQSEMTANLSTEMYDTRVEAEFTGTQINIDGRDNHFYDYFVMEGSLKMKDPKNDQVLQTMKTKNLRAFHEGNMFVLSTEDNLTQKLYSSLTSEEYIAYLEKQSSISDFDFDDCVNSSFVKNEDKSWTLSFSGYTKAAIDEVIESFGDELFEEEINDMQITIQANANFTVKDIEFKFVFENESSTSAFSMKQRYYNYGEATPIVDTLDVSDYTHISDCRLLTDIEDMIGELQEAEDGSFVLDITQKVSTSKPVINQTSTEKDTVTYGKKEGNYFYNIKAKTDNATVDINYANGKQTVKVSGQSQTVDQTEKDAKLFINELINSAKYESFRVSNIEKLEDGTYSIRCDKPNESLYVPVLTSLGATLSEVSQTINITVNDGKITKISSTLNVTAQSSSYGKVTFKLTSVCEF